MGALLSLITWVLGKLFGKGPAASRAEVQAERAATAQTQLDQEHQANAVVQQAVEAARRSDADLARDPERLRDPSPDSRD